MGSLRWGLGYRCGGHPCPPAQGLDPASQAGHVGQGRLESKGHRRLCHWPTVWSAERRTRGTRCPALPYDPVPTSLWNRDRVAAAGPLPRHSLGTWTLQPGSLWPLASMTSALTLSSFPGLLTTGPGAPVSILFLFALEAQLCSGMTSGVKAAPSRPPAASAPWPLLYFLNVGRGPSCAPITEEGHQGLVPGKGPKQLLCHCRALKGPLETGVSPKGLTHSSELYDFIRPLSPAGTPRPQTPQAPLSSELQALGHRPPCWSLALSRLPAGCRALSRPLRGGRGGGSCGRPVRGPL